MGYTDDIIKGNIEEWVDHLEKMCHLFAQSYIYLSQTEFGGAMHNILLGIRRLRNAVLQVANEQRNTLLIVTPIKTNKILQVLGHIRSDISVPQSFDVEKKEEEDTTDWNALIKIENNDSPFNIGDDYEEYHKTRFFLMSSIRRNYFESVDYIKEIISLLKEIDDRSIKIETNIDTQRTIFNKMLDDYRKTEWSQDRSDFIAQVNATIDENNEKGIVLFDTLKSVLSELKHMHLNSFMPAYIKRVYRTVINQKRQPYEAIVRNRKKLTVDDISDYFSFLFRYQTLKEHIDSIPLLKPSVGEYADLFTCQAAILYVKMLKSVIWVHGGIENKEHFAILYLAMKDLGLAKADTSPFLLMANFANEINESDDRLVFKEGKNKQAMITKVAGKFNNTRFCELEFGEAGPTGFTEDKMKEYQMVYWRCFVILNQRGLRMPKEINVAHYLKNPHPKIDLSIIMEGFSRENLIKLNFLRSVLRRETLVFG